MNTVKHTFTLYRDRITCSTINSEGPPPPINYGARETKYLTPKAAQKIKRACRYIDYVGSSCYMYTMTYCTDVCHVEAKKHLSRFFKRVKRAYETFPYVWVAEIQEKRYLRTGDAVIHFHVITSTRLSVEFLRTAWNETSFPVHKYLGDSEKPLHRVHAVKLNGSASSYMAKTASYLGKGSSQPIIGNRYGISSDIREMMKPFAAVTPTNGLVNIGIVFEDYKSYLGLRQAFYQISGERSCMSHEILVDLPFINPKLQTHEKRNIQTR